MTFQELAVASAYEIATLLSVMEQKGLMTQAEVLEKITRLRDKSGEAH